jgi:DMSO/TMAO reductase YedYZ molybdopterin-dependent catalytic subunit
VARLSPTRLAERFRSPLRDTRTVSLLGLGLAVTFPICFLTGLLSHLIQHPPGWLDWPSRPAGLYRVTQGVHVATGIASIPLLLAKVWTVYPKLWEWPPVRGVAHAFERLGVLVLVAASLFQLLTGVQNIALWYPWSFSFTTAHYWMAWITIGALLVHVAMKGATTRAALARGAPGDGTAEPVGSSVVDLGLPPHPGADPHGGLSRRGFLGWVAAAAGVLTAATVGQTWRPFRRVSVLGPRRPDVGPQGVPVNRTAERARVREAAVDPRWRLRVEGRVARPMSLSLDELRALPQHEALLPISCVEGWSAVGRWRGVRVRDLLAMAGARPRASARVESLQPGRSPYRRSMLDAGQAHDADALLALELNGEPLHLDHGFPLRLIAPNRPGVLQTKWVHRVVAR